MGDKNSSKTIVLPLMEQLHGEDPGTFDQVSFCKIMNAMTGGIRTPHFSSIGNVLQICYQDTSAGKQEKSLRPAYDRLEFLISHSDEFLTEKNIDCKEPNRTERLRLISPDPAIRENARRKALKLLQDCYDQKRGKPYDTYQRDWWVLEGSSCPDIFIETDKYIFVGEVKRTETSTTEYVKYGRKRQQLVRHVEGAAEYRGHLSGSDDPRQIISFYILDEEFVAKKRNQKVLDLTAKGDPTKWEDSLEHTGKEMVEEYKNSYIGYTTVNVLMDLGFQFEYKKQYQK